MRPRTHNKKIRPFKVLDFTPFQISMIDVGEFIEKRRAFTADEWIDILVNSFGLSPDQTTRREKLVYLSRAIPLVESNHNLIELGPRETGKTYLYRNAPITPTFSPAARPRRRACSSTSTRATWAWSACEAVVFDEIANTDFTDPKAMVSIMQGWHAGCEVQPGR